MPTTISGTTGVSQVQDGVITDADISSTAGIQGLKISPEFGSDVPLTSLYPFGARLGRPNDFWGGAYYAVDELGSMHTRGSFEVSITSNGYRTGVNPNTFWTSLSAGGATGASQISLNPTGWIAFATNADKPTGSGSTPTERMRITSGGEVGIRGYSATNEPKSGNYLQIGDHTGFSYNDNQFLVYNNTWYDGTLPGNRSIKAGYSSYIDTNNNLGYIGFHVTPTSSTANAAVDLRQKMRIYSDNITMHNPVDAAPDNNSTGFGMGFTNTGEIRVSVDGESTPMFLNRNGVQSGQGGVAGNGGLIVFRRLGVSQGSITVASSTVSYNGGHLGRWSRFLNNEYLNILKGTVLSNLDQLIEWKYVEAVITPDKNLSHTETYTKVIPYMGPVEAGSTTTVTYNNKNYTGVVRLEENEQLNYTQISNIPGDSNIAGVFCSWDPEAGYNDFLCAMTGDFIIRIKNGTTVQRGDLLESAGDGTARPQGDDIVRSKTIAKVTSNHITFTYPDGSYCVPCVLMAC